MGWKQQAEQADGTGALAGPAALWATCACAGVWATKECNGAGVVGWNYVQQR